MPCRTQLSLTRQHAQPLSHKVSACALQKRSYGIQLPFPKSSHRWCVVGVDLSACLRRFTSSPLHSLRSVQMCSWLTVRSLYTSDLKFTLEVRHASNQTLCKTANTYVCDVFVLNEGWNRMCLQIGDLPHCNWSKALSIRNTGCDAVAAPTWPQF